MIQIHSYQNVSENKLEKSANVAFQTESSETEKQLQTFMGVELIPGNA